MKKIVKLSLALLIVVCIMGSVNAALSSSVSLQASKTQVSKNEQFTVDVNIANIQSERGIISLGATLEYDKDSLELVKMEGKNTWETPIEGISYNGQNGKIAITRGGLGKNNETVFTITFKVKESSKQNLIVTLKDITVADGTAPAKVATASKNITVKEGTANPNPDGGNQNNNQGNNNNSGNNQGTNNNGTTNNGNQKPNNTITTTKNGKLPQTGESNIILIVGLALVVVATVGIGIKLKFMNKEMK